MELSLIWVKPWHIFKNNILPADIFIAFMHYFKWRIKTFVFFYIIAYNCCILLLDMKNIVILMKNKEYVKMCIIYAILAFVMPWEVVQNWNKRIMNVRFNWLSPILTYHCNDNFEVQIPEHITWSEAMIGSNVTVMGWSASIQFLTTMVEYIPLLLPHSKWYWHADSHSFKCVVTLFNIILLLLILKFQSEIVAISLKSKSVFTDL